jgi:ribosomal protein S18 acetylase RimI-like enzyme/catechol 2,3-dioxygenase-like lactoylglutathione lyase family enzyme
MIAGVDHVQVAAPPGSEEAARAFYGALLGLPELDKPERLRARGGAWFAVGEQQLHVGIEEDFAPARKAHPALAVPRAAELDALAERLEAAGHAMQRDGPRIYVADPFGNRLELLAPHAAVTVRALREDERAWAADVLDESWGEVVITRGRTHRPAQLPALVAEAGEERAGLATYFVEDADCELVTLDALTIGRGIGGALVEAVAQAAHEAGAKRVHLVTTNDNLPALRLYQRHGFVLAELRAGEIEVTRRSKPSIPAIGHAGIPIRDELVLHRVL